jgi:hypothetical protein
VRLLGLGVKVLPASEEEQPSSPSQTEEEQLAFFEGDNNS